MNNFLKANDESLYSKYIFSDYMYKLHSSLARGKMILFVTEKYIY